MLDLNKDSSFLKFLSFLFPPLNTPPPPPPPTNRNKLKNYTGFNSSFLSFQFDAEFRRFAVDPQQAHRFGDFYKTIESVHRIHDIPFLLTYTDLHGDLLPINNDDNFVRAVTTAKPILRVFVQRKGKVALILISYYSDQKEKFVNWM